MLKRFTEFKNDKRIKSYKHIAFFVGYILYFWSWFFVDLASGVAWLGTAEKIMRYASYLLLAFCLLVIRRDRKEWIAFFLMGALGTYYFLISKELYLISLTLLVMVSMDEDITIIFKVSLGLLCVMVLSTLVLCMAGVLDNIVTTRSPLDPDLRYSLGFYHSNVLPLLLFYAIAYLGVIKGLRLNNWLIAALAAVTVVVYCVCNSRVSFLVTLALLALYAIYPRITLGRENRERIYWLCRRGILIFSLITLAMILLYPFNNQLILWLDERVLSSRIVNGYRKVMNFGFDFLNPISAAEYVSDGIILDNAYISAIIRYGWVSIVILSIVNFFGCEKYKRNTGEMIIFLLVCMVNFIDNDLLTYSCFPFLLAAFNKKTVNKKVQGRRDRSDLVSVIMSTYNEDERQLAASIGSILNQSYKNIEFIIVNDNPKNAQLRDLLEQYAQKDKRIVLVENPENIGLVNSLNKALSYIKGDYVARMDADDIARQDRISQQMRHLKNNELDFVGGYIRYIDEENNALGNTWKVPTTHEQICRAILWGNCLPHPTWLLRREVYEALGGYRHIPHAEDYDFILRAIKAGFQLGNVPAVLLNYRVRATGISVSNKMEQNMIRYYLGENRRDIFKITEEMVEEKRADQNNPYYRYDAKKNALKNAIKSKRLVQAAACMCKLITDRFFWFWLVEKARSCVF